jgi:hypothetical protein
MGIRASERPKPFASDKQVLEVALRMFGARKALADATRRWQAEDKVCRSNEERRRWGNAHDGAAQHRIPEESLTYSAQRKGGDREHDLDAVHEARH